MSGYENPEYCSKCGFIKQQCECEVVFKDTTFDMHKAFRDFKEEFQKVIDGKFTNADSIRNLDDNDQLALMLWNLPKFESIEKLKQWLDKEMN